MTDFKVTFTGDPSCQNNDFVFKVSIPQEKEIGHGLLKNSGEQSWSCCFMLWFYIYSALLFEKAYCEYRLNRTQEALATLRGGGDLDNRCKELLGQVVSLIREFVVTLSFLMKL